MRCRQGDRVEAFAMKLALDGVGRGSPREERLTRAEWQGLPWVAGGVRAESARLGGFDSAVERWGAEGRP